MKYLTPLLFLLLLTPVAHAQVFGQNQITISPYGGLVISTSTSGTRKLEQLLGGNYGDVTVWNGTRWVAVATSTLGITGGSGSPGGSSGQLQYNAAGTFGGVSTTTLVAGTNISFTGGIPVIVGTSPVTINASGGGSSFAYPFPSNATSTLLTFSGGLSAAGMTNSSLGAGTVNSTSGGLQYVTATSSVSNGTGISLTGTPGALIGGTNLTIANTGVISNSCPGGFLSCSGTNPSTFTLGTLGVANGGTGSTTLTGILKGNGTSAVQTAVAGTDYLIGSGTSGNCVQWGASNALTDAGSPCGSGSGGAAYPFTPTTNYAVTMSATSSPVWARAGLYASSSTAYPTLAVRQAGAGPAATFDGGNVGVGVTSPAQALDVSGSIQTNANVWLSNTSSAPVVGFKTTAGRVIYGGFDGSSQVGALMQMMGEANNGGSGLTPNGGAEFVIDSNPGTTKFNVVNFAAGNYTSIFTAVGSGKVGIGSSTPNGLLTVNAPAGTTRTSPAFVIGSSTGSYQTAFASPDGLAHVYISSTATTTQPVQTFIVNGTMAAYGVTSATGGTNNALCIQSNGIIVNETSATCSVSSERFKHDILTLDLPASELVKSIRAVSFSPNELNPADYQGSDYGFIAEEVAAGDPHLAKYGLDGLPRTLDDRALLAVLWKSAQEILARLDGSDARMDALEARIEVLENK